MGWFKKWRERDIKAVLPELEELRRSTDEIKRVAAELRETQRRLTENIERLQREEIDA